MPLLEATAAIKALGLLKRFWPAIPILGLAAWVGVQHLQLGWKDEALEKSATRLRSEVAARVEAEGNAARADGKIAQLNAESLARSAAYAEAIVKAQATQADLRARYARTSTRVATLEAAARSTTLPPCAISDVAHEALKGL